MIKIHFRGAMLFCCYATQQGLLLDRILIPRAETDEDVSKFWKHPSKLARKHYSGALLQSKGKRVHLRDRKTPIKIGDGVRPSVDSGVRQGLPELNNVLGGVVPKRDGFIEIVPRGNGVLRLAVATQGKRFDFAGAQKLYHFSCTLELTSSVGHNLKGIPKLTDGDELAIYNFDASSPSQTDLDEVKPTPCDEVPPDDDFFWVYGLLENVDGTPLDVATLPVPVIDCGGDESSPAAKADDAVSVSTCFPGFLWASL